MNNTVARTRSAPTSIEQNIARAVRTLVAYHDISWDEVANILGFSTDTLGRRIKRGGWLSTEVEVLTAYFSSPRDAFLDGNLDVASSRLDPRAAQALSMYLRTASDLQLLSA
jgi:hypothetical protein